MADPTPQEFADSLGLAPGMNAPPAKPLEDSQLRAAEAIMKTLVAKGKKSAYSDYPFWFEFGSRFLPALLRTFFDTSRNLADDQTRASEILYDVPYRFIYLNNRTARVFQRFIRARPDEVVGFFHNQIERLVSLSTLTARSRAHGQDLFSIHARLTSVVVMNLAVTLAQDTLDQFLRGSGGDSARSALPALVCSCNRLVPADKKTFKTWCLDYLERTLVAKDDPKETYDASHPPPYMFLHCQESAGRDPVGPDCVKPAEGAVSLSECAGCHCIYYCSRAHQRKHWKEHKLFCFPPGW